MLDIARQDIGDGLDAPMRVPGEALEILVGMVRAEVVEQQEGIEQRGAAEAEGAAEMDAGPFQGGDALRNLLQGANGHGFLLGFHSGPMSRSISS